MSTRAGGRDQALAGDDDGAGADDDVDVVRGVRVAGPADRDDPSLTDSDARLTDSEDRVDHDDVGDDHVAGLLGRTAFSPMPSRAVLANPVSSVNPSA